MYLAIVLIALLQTFAESNTMLIERLLAQQPDFLFKAQTCYPKKTFKMSWISHRAGCCVAANLTLCPILMSGDTGGSADNYLVRAHCLVTLSQ